MSSEYSEMVLLQTRCGCSRVIKCTGFSRSISVPCYEPMSATPFTADTIPDKPVMIRRFAYDAIATRENHNMPTYVEEMP